jgi:hypothetical protein
MSKEGADNKKKEIGKKQEIEQSLFFFLVVSWTKAVTLI